MYSVYKHTAPNGKVYIGITSQNPAKRWNNGNGYKNNPHFSRAIKKYGWDNFKHEILYNDLSHQEAEKCEIELIAQYRSNDVEYGFNITSGGECAGKHSEKSKQIMSEKITEYYKSHDNPRKGRHWDKEHRDDMKDKAIQRFVNKENHPMTGTHRSEKTKAKISAHHADFTGSKHPKAKKIICVETGKIYGCIKEAKNEVHTSHISECCRGVRETSGGLHWRFADV